MIKTVSESEVSLFDVLANKEARVKRQQGVAEKPLSASGLLQYQYARPGQDERSGYAYFQ